MEGSNVLGFVKGAIYTLFVFLDIDASVFNILMAFMVIDTITGVLKTLKLDKNKFSFKILLWGLVSKLGILIVPLIVALLLKAVGNESMGFGVELVIKILIVSEFMSSIGNIYTLKTSKTVEDIDIFSMLFRFLRCRSLKLLGAYMGKEIYDQECKDTKTKSDE